MCYTGRPNCYLVFLTLYDPTLKQEIVPPQKLSSLMSEDTFEKLCNNNNNNMNFK